MVESSGGRRCILSGFALLMATLLIALEATTDGQDQGPRCNGGMYDRQEVILIRGGLGYWPRVQSMAAEFNNLGYAPTIIQNWEYPFVAKRIAREICEGRRSSEIIIVGYSNGADTACMLAKRLEFYSLRVKTLVLIESTLGTRVPANVDYCQNFYISRMMDAVPLFRGIPVQPENPNTVVLNYNLKGEAEFEDIIRRNHLFIGSTNGMRQITVQAVESRQNPMIAPRSEWAIGGTPQRTYR